MLYSVVLVSAIQQHESAISILMSPPSRASLPLPKSHFLSGIHALILPFPLGDKISGRHHVLLVFAATSSLENPLASQGTQVYPWPES